MGLLTITVARGDHGPVISLAGEADITTVPQLAAALAAAADGGARHVTVDLSALRFADSATVGALVTASRSLRAVGGVLELARPQPTVARTLRLLGVDQVIAVIGDVIADSQPEGA
ncbi:MAG TPA: STAS domain-containing protein [Trebonia sp.]|nr:STAS domain-containing protein [Trebonia sp.]